MLMLIIILSVLDQTMVVDILMVGLMKLKFGIMQDSRRISSTMYTPPSLEQLGLIAYYNFNSGSGNTLYDQTSNSLNGSIMGGPQWVDGFTISGILGDVNFDENLNIYDAVMLVAIMLGVENGTDLQLNVCDTNQDGLVNIEDVVLLFEWILDIDYSNRNILTNGKYTVMKINYDFI